ncbi:hypothetical protein [Microlunatus parietis]|uniref:Uncharacterized protein n=1 Tax=Microlunatus parietis TaxID=682979 RepID=A0A7Y9LA05_9ACTN|nr:hypothetical protein [Microlunatus parietis]NYE70142.1 hypothetical protein [Microlunatus parietis]
MSELLSMVVPLETLSGWPEVANPTALQTLGLLIGIPGLVFVAIFALGKAPSLIRANQRQSLAVTEPVWLGRGAELGQLEQGAAAGELPAAPVAETGGASARW